MQIPIRVQSDSHPPIYLSSSTLQLVQWKCFAAWPPNSYKNRSLGPFPCWSYLGVAVSPEGSHTTFWNHRFHGKFSALKTSSKKFVNIVFNIESNTHSYIHHIQYSFCHLSWLHDVPPQGSEARWWPTVASPMQNIPLQQLQEETCGVQGVFPKDSVWDHWGTLGKIRGITTPPLRILLLEKEACPQHKF